MSWLDKINNVVLEVTTGDGKKYTPKWLNAVKNVNYNTEGADPVDIEGTDVSRGAVSGAQYPVEFYFEGDDHLDTFKAFEISAKDRRSWTIKHPYYDDIRVHPLTLSFDNSVHNITKITGTVWETILDEFPQETLFITKEVAILKEDTYAASIDSFEEDFIDPEAGAIASATDSVNAIDTSFSKLPAIPSEVTDLKNLVRTASGVASNVLNEPVSFIAETQALIDFPFKITQNISSKINAIKNSVSDLASRLLGDNLTNDSGKMFEAFAFSSVVASCQNAVTASYPDRKSVVSIIDLIIGINDLVNISFEDNLYVPNDNTALIVDNTVQLTVSELQNIAFEAKQERSIILEKDSNMVLLAHRLYGPGDDNLDLFIENNGILLNEFLGIKKGRTILYYV